jgi:two-component system KDP operon response regulator KdpE
MSVSILLIDDDSDTVHAVQPALAHEGYLTQHALPSRNAIRQVLVEEPDLVILGINTYNGEWDFCRKLLTFLESPLLLLLASQDRFDRVRGLDMGADACMFRPALIPDFLAQVRALLRMGAPNQMRQVRSFFVDGDLEVDLTRREVQLNDEPIALSPTEFRVLSCLVRHRSRILSHERLLSEVWGPGRVDDRKIIKQYIYSLRQKLETDPGHAQRIVTVRGEGYVLRPLEEDAKAVG